MKRARLRRLTGVARRPARSGALACLPEAGLIRAAHAWAIHAWKDGADLYQLMRAAGADGESTCFIALQVRLDDHLALLQRLDMEALYTVKRRLMAITQGLFQRMCCAFTVDDMMTVILWRDGFVRMDELGEPLERLRDAASHEFGLRLTVGIGTHALRPEDVPERARNALIATQYRMIFGPGQNIEYDKIRMRVGLSVPYPKEIERELLDMLRRGNGPGFEMKLSAFFDAICMGSANYVEIAVPALLMQIFRALPEERQANCDLVGVHVELHACEHYLPQQRILRAFGLRNMREPGESEDSRSRALVESVVQYVEQNYPNPDLSVTAIAEHVNVSANTVRQIFRDHLNSMPRDYITQLRINRACRLLVTTGKTAKEIAAMVGFTESRYFYSVFKKQTGETAFEYRIHNVTRVK